MYEAEKNLPVNIQHAIGELDGIHERVERYAQAEDMGVRCEVRNVLRGIADIERHLYALAGELRKAERLTEIPPL